MSIKNEQSGNIGHTKHRTKANRTQKDNTTQTTTKMSNTDSTKTRGGDTSAHEGLTVPSSYKTPAMGYPCT